jgi:hypothetical protein
MKLSEQIPSPTALGTPLSRDYLVDVTGGIPQAARRRSASPAMQELQALSTEMTPKRRSIVSKYLQDNPDATEETILARIKAGTL